MNYMLGEEIKGNW